MVSWPVKVWWSDCSGPRVYEEQRVRMMPGKFLQDPDVLVELESRNWDRLDELLCYCREWDGDLGEDESCWVPEESWEQLRNLVFGESR